MFCSPGHCGPFKYAFGEIIPWLFSKKFKMIFLVKYRLEKNKAELFEYYLHTHNLIFLFVTKKEVSTHYTVKGITIICKITMGLIDLLHNEYASQRT